MWIIVCFDLPTNTKLERKSYTDFRKSLLKLGYEMLQFSVYIRWCGSAESMETHFITLNNNLPRWGKVSVFNFTDRQFGMVKHFDCGNPQKDSGSGQGQQLELF